VDSRNCFYVCLLKSSRMSCKMRRTLSLIILSGALMRGRDFASPIDIDL